MILTLIICVGVSKKKKCIFLVIKILMKTEFFMGENPNFLTKKKKKRKKKRKKKEKIQTAPMRTTSVLTP